MKHFRFLIIFLCVFLLIVSCISTGSKHNRPRTIPKPIAKKRVPVEFFELIDTTKLYKQVYLKVDTEVNPIEKFQMNFLKFYKEGKVDIFRGFQPDRIETINPEFADMGLYRFKNGTLTLKEYIRTIQGSGWTPYKATPEEKNDTLTFTSDHYITKYVPVEIQKSFLIYSPDW